MPIQVEAEDSRVTKAFKVLEKCVFCYKETVFWHNKRTPICPGCANLKSLEDIPSK
jgi:hypothetical protein